MHEITNTTRPRTERMSDTNFDGEIPAIDPETLPENEAGGVARRIASLTAKIAELRKALKAAEYWLDEENAGPDTATPDDLLRVIRVALKLARDDAPAATGGWVKCSERMPEDGYTVIVSATCGCCDAKWMCSANWDRERNYWRDFDGDGEGGMGKWKVTHWMPLPPTPSE